VSTLRALPVLPFVLLAHTACADELVRFESARYRVGELQQRLARERGETIAPRPTAMLEAYLSKPKGDGPFPAVVSLHGCNGLRPALRTAEAERLNALGYVSLVVDSFATRGIKEACVSPMPDRHADAIGALAYLSKLRLQVASSPDVYDIPDDLTYKAIVAFYPPCRIATDELALPALVMIGDSDDWTPAKACERWMARRAGRGAPVKFIVYPGAYHAFDSRIAGDGLTLFGHRLKSDAEATKSAGAEVAEFLRQYLGR